MWARMARATGVVGGSAAPMISCRGATERSDMVGGVGENSVAVPFAMSGVGMAVGE